MGCNTSQETLPKNPETDGNNEQGNNENVTKKEDEEIKKEIGDNSEDNIVGIGSERTTVASFPRETDNKDIEEAATKIQAAFRGHKSRKSMKQPTTGTTTPASTTANNPQSASEAQKMEEEFRADDAELCHAASVIQASFRGHLARKTKDDDNKDEGQSDDYPNKEPTNEEELDIDLGDPELNKAATKIQATFRGHMSRKDNDEN